MSARYNMRFRSTDYRPFVAPAAGAGGFEQTMDTFSMLKHAVKVAVEYFRKRPLDHDQASFLRQLISARARANWARVSGEKDDYLVVILVNDLSDAELAGCVLPKPMARPFHAGAMVAMPSTPPPPHMPSVAPGAPKRRRFVQTRLPFFTREASGGGGDEVMIDDTFDDLC